MAKETKQEIDLSNKIVLKSVRGKVGIVIKMQPCRDPKTGNWPDCVKRVDSNGNMILSEKELNDPNRDYFIREDAVINVVDGMTFDLNGKQLNIILLLLLTIILRIPKVILSSTVI